MNLILQNGVGIPKANSITVFVILLFMDWCSGEADKIYVSIKDKGTHPRVSIPRDIVTNLLPP